MAPLILIAEYEGTDELGHMRGNQPDIDKSGLLDLHFIDATNEEIQSVKEAETSTKDRLQEVLSGLLEKYKK